MTLIEGALIVTSILCSLFCYYWGRRDGVRESRRLIEEHMKIDCKDAEHFVRKPKRQLQLDSRDCPRCGAILYGDVKHECGPRGKVESMTIDCKNAEQFRVKTSPCLGCGNPVVPLSTCDNCGMNSNTPDLS